ncbi:hypothetical protein I79_018264 [Cricetulus griseus]|uniref:Uncharacterized protein n=1 Tax=Cricetulus griseus TaxID=10029 RepID=G3I487_CRIGR|nr:hypothetical protein I79_018264 [Cricetulus griseus]
MDDWKLPRKLLKSMSMQALTPNVWSCVLSTSVPSQDKLHYIPIYEMGKLPAILMVYLSVVRKLTPGAI